MAPGSGHELHYHSRPLEHCLNNVFTSGLNTLPNQLTATPTQYEFPSQKPVLQSSLTAGFHSRNCFSVIAYSAATSVHESPALTVYHASHAAGWPDCLGGGNVVDDGFAIDVVAVDD